jgi:hypothetical protein
VETLVKMAEDTAKRSVDPLSGDSAEWEKHMDAAYASLGGFQMQEDGLVVKVGDCKQLHQPFRNRNRRNNYPGRRQQ